jgi:hypothetical protein
MSERQRSVGETTTSTSLLFRAFWATSPAWPHARAFTRTPHTLCDASILAPSSIAILPFVALRRRRPHRDTTEFYRLRDGPQKYLRVLLSEAGLFTSMASSQGISEQRRPRQQLPDHIIQPPLRARSRTRYATVRWQLSSVSAYSYLTVESHFPYERSLKL